MAGLACNCRHKGKTERTGAGCKSKAHLMLRTSSKHATAMWRTKLDTSSAGVVKSDPTGLINPLCPRPTVGQCRPRKLA